jgi:heme exporter protein C
MTSLNQHTPKGITWWKWMSIALLLYTVIAGMTFRVPDLPIIYESIRNLYFHVPMWFGMIFIFTASMVGAIRYLRSNDMRHDWLSVTSANVGMFMGILGLVTGMIWAQYTWGSPWHNDPKQVGSAVSLLIYAAYFVLRGSLQDPQRRAKISAVYNLYAYALLIPLLFILPRMTDSMHPGNGGNPGFNSYDLDSRMRMVFYPAVVGWTLLGAWLVDLQIRMRKLTARRQAAKVFQQKPSLAKINE